jgi:hypothetical protein
MCGGRYLSSPLLSSPPPAPPTLRLLRNPLPPSVRWARTGAVFYLPVSRRSVKRNVL